MDADDGTEQGTASGTGALPAAGGMPDTAQAPREEGERAEEEKNRSGTAAASRTTAARLDGVAARLDSQAVQIRAVSAETDSLHSSVETVIVEVRRLRAFLEARQPRGVLGTAFLSFLLGVAAAGLGPWLLRRWRSRDGTDPPRQSASLGGLLDRWRPGSRGGHPAEQNRRGPDGQGGAGSGGGGHADDAHAAAGAAGFIPRLEDLLRTLAQAQEDRAADRQLLRELAAGTGFQGSGDAEVLRDLLRRADRAEQERVADRHALHEMAERLRRTEALLNERMGRGSSHPPAPADDRPGSLWSDRAGGRGGTGMGAVGWESEYRELPHGSTNVHREERLLVQLNEEGIFVPYPEPVSRPMAEILFQPGASQARAYILSSFLFGMDSRRLQIAYNVDRIDSGRYATENPADIDWSDGPNRGRVKTKGTLRYIGS